MLQEREQFVHDQVKIICSKSFFQLRLKEEKNQTNKTKPKIKIFHWITDCQVFILIYLQNEVEALVQDSAFSDRVDRIKI